MFASEFCIWMVGWFTWMFLSGLHSCMDSFRLVMWRGGCMNLLSFHWMWLSQQAYFWVVFSLACFLWCCVIRSILCSRSKLSGCSGSSSFRHCCMVPCGACNWHRYFFLIACTPHLFFFVMVISCIIVWIAWPSIGLGIEGGVLTMISPCGGVCCVGLIGFVGGGGGILLMLVGEPPR